MAKVCQNPVCRHKAVKEVAVSVDGCSHEKRALCAACLEVYTWGVGHGRTVQPGWLLEPPPTEQGAEPLFRVVYVIDINAGDTRQAAERAYEIMRDPNSMPPVLEILTGNGRRTEIDLATE